MTGLEKIQQHQAVVAAQRVPPATKPPVVEQAEAVLSEPAKPPMCHPLHPLRDNLTGNVYDPAESRRIQGEM